MRRVIISWDILHPTMPPWNLPQSVSGILFQYSQQDHMLRCPLYSKSVFITVTKKLQARALGAREHEIACFVVAIIHCNDKQDAHRQRKPTPCLAWGTWNSLAKTPPPPPTPHTPHTPPPHTPPHTHPHHKKILDREVQQLLLVLLVGGLRSRSASCYRLISHDSHRVKDTRLFG